MKTVETNDATINVVDSTDVSPCSNDAAHGQLRLTSLVHRRAHRSSPGRQDKQPPGTPRPHVS